MPWCSNLASDPVQTITKLLKTHISIVPQNYSQYTAHNSQANTIVLTASKGFLLASSYRCMLHFLKIVKKSLAH